MAPQQSKTKAGKSRRHSLDQAAVSAIVYCEGYARLKKRNALTWNTRFLVLSGADLLVFANKQDASYRRNVVEALEITGGRVAPRVELGLEFALSGGREMQGRVFSRADQAAWVSAFYQLALKNDVRRVKSSSSMDAESSTAAAEGAEKRHVSFFGSVLVRTIPTLPDDQVAELFYSKKEVAKFSEQAGSVLGRTGDAVSLACRALRRPKLSWSRQLV